MAALLPKKNIFSFLILKSFFGVRGAYSALPRLCLSFLCNREQRWMSVTGPWAAGRNDICEPDFSCRPLKACFRMPRLPDTVDKSGSCEQRAIVCGCLWPHVFQFVVFFSPSGHVSPVGDTSAGFATSVSASVRVHIPTRWTREPWAFCAFLARLQPRLRGRAKRRS